MQRSGTDASVIRSSSRPAKVERAKANLNYDFKLGRCKPSQGCYPFQELNNVAFYKLYMPNYRNKCFHGDKGILLFCDHRSSHKKETTGYFECGTFGTNCIVMARSRCEPDVSLTSLIKMKFLGMFKTGCFGCL